MNPKEHTSNGWVESLAEEPQMSEFDKRLFEAEKYFGADFPGHEGLTCRVCGAAVNLGWTHMDWHEESKA